MNITIDDQLKNAPAEAKYWRTHEGVALFYSTTEGYLGLDDFLFHKYNAGKEPSWQLVSHGLLGIATNKELLDLKPLMTPTLKAYSPLEIQVLWNELLTSTCPFQATKSHEVAVNAVIEILLNSMVNVNDDNEGYEANIKAIEKLFNNYGVGKTKGISNNHIMLSCPSAPDGDYYITVGKQSKINYYKRSGDSLYSYSEKEPHLIRHGYWFYYSAEALKLVDVDLEEGFVDGFKLVELLFDINNQRVETIAERLLMLAGDTRRSGRSTISDLTIFDKAIYNTLNDMLVSEHGSSEKAFISHLL